LKLRYLYDTRDIALGKLSYTFHFLYANRLQLPMNCGKAMDRVVCLLKTVYWTWVRVTYSCNRYPEW